MSITVEHLVKSYGQQLVLNDISFSIGSGEIVGFLGNNGAGKSTLLNIIAGRVARDEGEISTNLDFKSQVSMMPQGDILIDDLKVKETVELKCLMNGMKGFNVDSFLDRVDLRRQTNVFVSALSGGQKRRLSFLLTVVNDPSLVFLDEPTTGMDLESVDNFWQLLGNGNYTSVTVTHDFNQIDKFFTRVLILKNGVIAADEPVESIHARGLSIEQFYREVNGKKA